MNYVLLLGAGFSHNWGGWLASEAFEYLLGCPEIQQDQTLKDLMWQHKDTGGFEAAITQVQQDHGRIATDETANRLQRVQTAVARMFDDMNKAFLNLELHDWEFRSDRHNDKRHELRVSTFLGKFDAVFTLNQDILIERWYHGDERAFTLHQKFSGGPSLPGMQHHLQTEKPRRSSWAENTWAPMAESNFKVASDTQPFFKLHGSSNWHNSNCGDILIIGGNKPGAINLHPILKWYREMFEHYLCLPDTRLMVIGYGFRDQHINEVIQRGVASGTEFFVIDPQGSNFPALIAQQPSFCIPEGHINLEETFRKGLIGASRRSLRGIFSGDTVEFDKLNRFFH